MQSIMLIEHTQERLLRRLKRDLLVFPGYPVLLKALVQSARQNIYLAGGAIRNTVLSRPINDIDLFLPAAVLDRVIEALPSGHVVAGPLGSPRWFVDADAYFDLVALEHVDHGLGRCENILDVLNQFDFTGNAIAYNPITDEIIDPKNGLDDLHAGVLRSVRFDWPDRPMRKNIPVTWRADRWFRLLHYAATLDLSIERATADWLEKNSDCMGQYDEFSRFFFKPDLLAKAALDTAAG